MKELKLEEEEKKILESFERDEWEPVPDLEKEVKRHQIYARNTLKKDKRINIRISSKDLEELQLFAIEDGIPYQTLISSILHRFLSGRLVEKPRQTNRINQSPSQ
ncbi:MAG: antitoxin [Candidatus Sabulitectum sp.]|nr:antitoxin [Candidatus Sabulitectum sp.]